MTIVCRYMPVILLMYCSFTGITQTRHIDSLEKAIYIATSEEHRLSAIVALCDEYKSLKRDTLDRYAFLARDLALKSSNKRLKQLAELAVAYDYLRWGWLDSVVVTVNPLIKENKAADPVGRDIYFKASRLKAMSYAGHSYYQEGLAILYQVVSEAEICKDSLTLAENFNSIASIALARGQPGDAFTWLSRALSLSTNDGQFKAIRAAVYVNLADACHQSGKKDSANIYIDKGIALFRETEVFSNLALALQRQSNMLIDAGKLDQAEISLRSMTAIRRQLGDDDMYLDENLSLVNFYLETRQIQKAIQTCKRLLKSGDLHSTVEAGGGTTFSNNINIRLGYYEALAKCYKITGEADLYRNVLEKIIAAKDSFYQYNSARAIAELETKYEVQKKENTIIQQQLDITRKNDRFYTLLGGAFFIAVIAVLLFTGYRKRERLRMNVILEKEKLQAEQSVARAEENERKRIAADLHDNLGAYAASIVSNLDLIEFGMADPSATTAVKELRNNSLAIVSQLNDTIWALKKDTLSLTALSDRIKVFIQRIQQSYPSISISVTEEIGDDLMLSPSHALHLFRIVQEAVNNALRHSGGREVTVLINSGAGKWEIAISDDGTGIKQEAAGGNGLINMEGRAEKSGWKIRWLPGDQGGTVVKISNENENYG